MDREGLRPRWGLALAGLGVFAGAVTVLCVETARYLPFFADDALISLRYAQRLLGGHGLTWTDGPRVEGYSNFLWILAVAALGKLRIDLIVAARGLGYASMAGALGAVVYAGARDGTRGLMGAAAGALVLALAGWTAVWTIGGLEQPMVLLWLLWALVLGAPLVDDDPPSATRCLACSALFGLLCLTRLDGALFVAAASIALVVARGFSRDTLRRAAALSSIPTVLYVGQLVFRRVYYGGWVPNTALVKVAFSAHRVYTGLAYVATGARSAWPICVLIVAAIVRGLAHRRRRTIWLVVPLLTWTAYLVAVGGDIFPGKRHLLVLLGIGALLLVEATLSPWPRTRGRAVALVAATAALLGLFVRAQRDAPENVSAILERWEWDGKAVGTFLKRGFPAAPTLAVDPSGCVPYFSELPSIDMLGLNDDYLPRHPPPSFGDGWIGHELGDGRYVLGRDPDLVLLCTPRGSPGTGCFRSGIELLAHPEFRVRYTQTVFEPEPGLLAFVWVRHDSGKLGVVHTDGALTLPAFFFEGTLTRLDAHDRFTTLIAPHGSARATGISLPAGRWQARLEPATADVTVRLSATDGSGASMDGALIDLAAPTRALSLELVNGGDHTVEIAVIHLTRLSPGL